MGCILSFYDNMIIIIIFHRITKKSQKYFLVEAQLSVAFHSGRIVDDKIHKDAQTTPTTTHASVFVCRQEEV